MWRQELTECSSGDLSLYGDFSWPKMGILRWPLTFVCCCRVYSYVETASLGFTTMLLGLLNLDNNLKGVVSIRESAPSRWGLLYVWSRMVLSSALSEKQPPDVHIAHIMCVRC